jgi:hypothetical protein
MGAETVDLFVEVHATPAVGKDAFPDLDTILGNSFQMRFCNQNIIPFIATSPWQADSPAPPLRKRPSRRISGP